jgi:hypothetical protein
MTTEKTKKTPEAGQISSVYYRQIGQDKHIEIFILVFWAHFRRFAPETGLSASIPRFYLR